MFVVCSKRLSYLVSFVFYAVPCPVYKDFGKTLVVCFKAQEIKAFQGIKIYQTTK